MYNDPNYLFTQEEKANYIRKNWNHTLSERTIQRCLDEDKRIIKSGWHYSIDEKWRYETRYQDAREFGLKLYDAVIGRACFDKENVGTFMPEFIRRIGAIIVFIFIEASRPFKDDSMKPNDMDDLVEYWTKNAVPIPSMLLAFRTVFNWVLRDKRVREGKTSLTGRSWSQMEQSQVSECLRMLENSCPDIYKDLASYKDVDKLKLG